MENPTNEDKLKMSKETVDSFVKNFEPEGEASKKFVLAFLQLLLGKEEEKK